MHDIRQSIPLTDQTNPGKFPQYEFRAYPRMVSDDAGKPILGPDKAALIANSEDEYNALRAKHHTPSVPSAGVASLTVDNDEVAKLRAELAELKSAQPERRKPGRPARADAA